MTAADIKAHVLGRLGNPAAPFILEEGLSAVDIDDSMEVLCSQKSADGNIFAVAKLKTGKIAVFWTAHGMQVDTLERLTQKPTDDERAYLNKTELELLRYNAHV